MTIPIKSTIKYAFDLTKKHAKFILLLMLVNALITGIIGMFGTDNPEDSINAVVNFVSFLVSTWLSGGFLFALFALMDGKEKEVGIKDLFTHPEFFGRLIGYSLASLVVALVFAFIMMYVWSFAIVNGLLGIIAGLVATLVFIYFFGYLFFVRFFAVTFLYVDKNERFINAFSRSQSLTDGSKIELGKLFAALILPLIAIFALLMYFLYLAFVVSYGKYILIGTGIIYILVVLISTPIISFSVMKAYRMLLGSEKKA